MANELTLTVGTGAVSQPIKGTPLKIRTAIRRFVIGSGYSVSGLTEEQIGRRALWLLLRYALEISQSVQSQELLEVQESQISITAGVDNDLLDPLVND